MMLTMDGYRDMSALMVSLAQEVCDGRLVMLQAGGYSAAYVPYCTSAAVEALVGVDLGIVDLYADSPELERCKTIMTHDTEIALLAARDWHKHWWSI
jgi:acetoin utilization deacetylase AcuC-like enzyme